MDVMWWPLEVAGALVLCVCVALALTLPMRRVRGLRPLAHVDRLTKLPEYARVLRRQFWSLLVIAVLLVGVFLTALIAAARPLGPRDADAPPPQDVMLCVGAPVTDPATAGLLNHYARLTPRFDGQLIGLTSASLRVVPLTRDYRFATDSFLRYARLAALQRQQPLSPVQENELQSRIGEFSRPLDYADYARSVNDVLALCLAGFPEGGPSAERPRSVIYLGPGDIRDAGEPRPSLFTRQQVTQLADARGVQVHAITATESGDLRAITTDSGGLYTAYGPDGTDVDLSGGTNPELAAALDEIARRPAAVGEQAGPSRLLAESPDVVLIVGVVVAALFSTALVVVRR